jgi:hypothetical protein|tara:strand:- start:728 stop:1234 length:507 start_codon:yes stop_codon:yes gene_type:complete
MNFFAKRTVKQQLSLLDSRVGVKPATIGRMVFVHDADLDITEAQFKDMIDFFSPEYKTIERVYFHLNKKMLEGLPKPHLHPKSLDWRGRIAEDDLKFVLLQPYDIAIHFVQHSTLSLASFSAQLKASFRIGPSCMDTRLNDLVLPTRLDFGGFLSDLKNYYNKINPHA